MWKYMNFQKIEREKGSCDYHSNHIKKPFHFSIFITSSAQISIFSTNIHCLWKYPLLCKINVM